MMSNQMMQTLINPAFQSKMQLFDGTIASVGQSKPKNMSDYLGKQMLQYNRTYLTYDTRGKDRTQLSPSYNNLKASLVDGRSPVSQLSGMERENRLIYRQDDSPEERQPHSSSLHHAPEKQGFKLYNKSPAISSPPAVNPEAVAKKKREVDSSSQSSNNSIYLAIPKPVYGHNPCCDNLGCVIGQRYSMEPGSQRIPNTMYEHEWMKAGVHYNEKPPIQTNKDVLLQQSGLQFEPSVDQMKRIPVETYSPDRARTLPTLIEPSYTSYPCPLTPTLFGSFTEQSSRNSSRGYPNFYPSHHTYEHMTSEFYQEHSPMSKYGHLTQHPVFYYTQADVEVESSTPCKDVGSKQRGDVPVFLNHTVSNPREHYMVPQSLHGEIRLPLARAEALQNHPLKQGFSYPCFAYPRINLNASQIRRPTKRQQTLPILNSKYINVSPSSQCIEHPITSATNLHKDKPSNILPVSAHCNLPVLHVEQVSPARRQSQRGLSPSVLQMKRFPSPLSSLHIEQPVPPSPVLNTDRYLDYSASEAQLRSPKHSKSFPVSPTARQEMSPCVDSDPAYLTLYKNSNAPKNIYFPAFAPPKNPFGPTSIPSFTVPKESPKRSLSHSSPPVKIKEEDKDLYEVELVKKRQKLEMENAQEAKTTDSPPMPVINNVFSLAPYHAYLQASAMLLASRMCETTSQSSEHCEVKTKPDDKDKEEDQEAEDPIVCQDSKEICANATLEKTKVEIVTPKNIKVEKEDSSDTCDPAKSPVSLKAHNKVEIKKEPDETCLSNEEHMLVIKKYEPDELESLPLLTPKQERSDEVELEEMTERMNSSPQGDTNMLHDEMCIIQPKSVTPLRPPEHKLNFKNIPPQCLKLSAYKLFLRHTTHSGPDPPLEKPDPQLTAECSPKQDVQIPVRKHFFEIHQSLHQLISKSVSASSENELRAWLSQLALTDPASSSTKIQKVSCLLGVKARETWINEEIKSALHMLLERLREYIAQERCPFPHVMRTRTVFLPMLVVKEMMFPMVQGSFIDQVLQEHKVELRPTTLSEEKILIQLCKRACSSRLMRLMSLKHLPDIYLDVVNISYYTCVCRHLGLDVVDLSPKVKDDYCEVTISTSPALYDITASLALPENHALRHIEDQGAQCNLKMNRKKSRVKSSSRRMFLDDSLSDEEKTEDAVSVGVLNAFRNKNLHVHQSEETEIPLSTTSDNSWTCPLTLDELSPLPNDPETEPSGLWPVSQSAGSTKPAGGSNSCSGMILKLRRMFSEGLGRKKAHYQKISGSKTCVDPPLSQTDNEEGKVSSKRGRHRRTPVANHRWQRTGSFSHTVRSLSGSSKRKQKSLLKIKYCPYLAACHSAERRRRWVLRSAVQRAQRALRLYFPDLVGKRIHHLYEEDDKSEVWYSGEVLRVHEAHSNPLKTVYEVRYDSEPEWKYYLELLIDYEKGWLKIED